MKYLIKYSPEITIKSRPVRTRFVKQLRDNLRRILARVDEGIRVHSSWDYIDVTSPNDDAGLLEQLEEFLVTTPGVCFFVRVRQYPLGDMDSILEHTMSYYADKLKGLTFAVRCKRAGKHTFKSNDIERYVGGGLNQRVESAGVKLTKPDITVKLEIRDQDLFVIEDTHKGLGGFPLGTQDGVLSLISGGFDSAISSYMSIKRGLKTHYCFFNLGGHEHEIAVKEVALYLWMKYGSSHNVKFVTIPFEGVVGEILESIDNSQMGVVLKRMMLRAASKVAQEMNLEALVTGECVAQVSSQTLANLAVIDKVTDTLILRPLIMSEKQDIVDVAREIGTEEFSAAIPEYCGVISVKPTTRARMHRIEREESGFDFSVLDKAVEGREVRSINNLSLDREREAAGNAVALIAEPEESALIVDIRHPDEEERKPLQVSSNEVKKIPFYKLNTAFNNGELSKEVQCLLYCEKGIMSQLHASYLLDQGYAKVGVYRPEPEL